MRVSYEHWGSARLIYASTFSRGGNRWPFRLANSLGMASIQL